MKRRAGQFAAAAGSGLGVYQIVSYILHPDDGPSVEQRAALTFGLPTDVLMDRTLKERRLRECKTVDDAVKVLYGQVPFADVQARKEKFGNVEWNDETLDKIKNMNEPILEICAGDGQWAQALKDRGVDVVASDNLSAPSRKKRRRNSSQ